MISTSIDGKKLKFYFNPSPVGDAKYTGPKLELFSRDTYFAYGGYCDAAAPSVIPPDGFGDIIIGDSYWGLASPVSLFTSFLSYYCSTSPLTFLPLGLLIFCRRYPFITGCTNLMDLLPIVS